MKERLTITEVAELVGISPKTLTRWEKIGKITKSKRDWRGWRTYEPEQVQHIKEIKEAVSEV